ncbi:MAG TPA: four-helix bundle copper-binding protein [Nitrospira sp.]|nr:four-helix bundle copper-binding protein [Nitrospira sp.]
MSTINRRTLVTTGASLLATGASVILWRGAEAAMQGATPRPSATEATMESHRMSEDMQRCIQLCQDCHARCIQLINHCLTLEGRHADPVHIRLVMDCAQLCTVTADFMARASAFHGRTCSLCAELCRRCAGNCEQIAGEDQLMKQCADLCRRCAESCDRMALHGAA